MTVDVKEKVREFWNETPCGTRGLQLAEGSREFFDQLEHERNEREPFIGRFARFDRHHGERVLEVGVGAATDFIRFARGGAKLWGVDLTPHAVALAERRLTLAELQADVRQSDAENLPFSDDVFDFVYSWGVIHHTPDTERAAREIVRVTRPGGSVCVMVYNRRSLVALQCWILHGLLKGRPWRTFADVIGHHLESIGTQAYTIGEAKQLFAGLEDVTVTPVVTPYDVRITRSVFLPQWMQRMVPARFGLDLVIQGRKAA